MSLTPFISSESNYGRKQIGRGASWQEARRKTQRAQRDTAQRGVWSVALLAALLEPLGRVFMLGLTRTSGERCDSLSGFRHIVAAK